MQRQMIIAIVGMPGVGKTEAAAFFRDKLHFGYLRFGDAVELGLKELGKSVNETNERWLRETIRRKFGMKGMAVKLKPHLKKMLKTKREIVLDGLYSWEEYEYLRTLYPELVLLCVYATPVTRYRRLSSRPHRPLKPSEARSRDIRELTHLNKGGPIALADFVVVNEGSRQVLFEELENVYRKLKRGAFYRGDT